MPLCLYAFVALTSDHRMVQHTRINLSLPMRHCLIFVLLAALLGSMPKLAGAQSDAAAWQALTAPGERAVVVLFRHANAPGTGDPAGFKLGDCSSQRNLDAAGRSQARRIGEQFKFRNVQVKRVLSSAWCRCQETATLAFGGPAEKAPAFNSFFEDAYNAEAQTAAASAQLLAWRGPGVLVAVTHQVNITALTGLTVSAGEGVVLSNSSGKLSIVSRLIP